MVLVGVSIEDNVAGGYDVYAINLQGDKVGRPDGKSDVKVINNITPADPAGNADIEGLGTLNNKVNGITESSKFNFRYDNVAPGPELKVALKGARLGDDVGFDYKGSTAYAIQGINDSGYQLYKIVGTTVSKVGVTNTKEFADGLAIPNATSTFGYASDFDNGDGDGAQLYKIDLGTGKIISTQAITTPAGFTLDQDSGLAFGAGKLYAIADRTQDLYQVTNFGGAGNAKLVFANDDLPSAVGKLGEFEGLAIANLNVTFVSSTSALFNTEAGGDVLTAAAATMFDSNAISSI
jgi:hypothetical protein